MYIGLLVGQSRLRLRLGFGGPACPFGTASGLLRVVAATGLRCRGSASPTPGLILRRT
jgi:hypothetical protein